MRVIVDAFGGDNAPLEIIKGAALAVKEYGHTVILVGREEEIRRVSAENGLSLEGMEIVDARDVISMEEEPKSILKEHKDCSMAVGLRRLAEGEGDAFVSAGSTGALIMGGTFFVKRIRGVSRAALAAIAPTDKGPFMLIDSGANVECRPDMLLQFAHMGSLYMTAVMNQGRPATVGLLNVGTEDHKGGELQHEAFALLKESGLHFVGNVEARDVPLGAVDVVVCDGFSGNVLLKSIEGTAMFMGSLVKRMFKKNVFTMLGALLCKSGLKNMMSMLDYREIGGTPFLGIRKPVIKAHGSSDALAFRNAIAQAVNAAKNDISADLEQMLAAVKEQSND